MGNTSCRSCDSNSEKDEAAATEDAKRILDDAPVEISEILRFLSEVKLFKRLPDDQRPVLASACKRANFAEGDVILKQGEEGDAFFMIKSGESVVEVDGKEVATLKQGDYFGENALLRGERRNATIKAKVAMQCFKITREDFVTLGLREKLDFPQRKAVPGGAKTSPMKPPSKKSDEDVQLIAKAWKSNSNLSSMVSLSDQHFTALSEVAWKDTVKAGVAVIEEGDTDADFFYIVEKGRFDVVVKSADSAKSAENAEANSAIVGSIEAGGSFGELALLYLAPRAATVKATEDSEVWVIDRSTFKSVLAKASDDTYTAYQRHLDKVELLNPLKEDEKLAVVKALTEMTMNEKDLIFQKGEIGEHFYLVIEGQVSVIKDGEEVNRLMAPCFFGERALMENEPRNATIQVVSTTAKCLALDRNTFNMLLGPLEELKKRGKDGASKLKDHKVQSAASRKGRFGVIRKKDLKALGLLGCGGFGCVELVEHVKTQDTYALKALSKGFICSLGMQRSILSEKEVQLLCDSEFVVKLYETFNGEQTLYFLLELALGGELYATYNKKGLFGREQHAKFYAAGVVQAFEHMHQRKIIYRDLKPENILLTEAGQLKITDMGLAKISMSKTFTTCGTPDYFAPEIIASTGHTHAVDWWTLGILIFELMAGYPPFESAFPMQTYQKVTKGFGKVAFPSKLRGNCEDLVKKLCHKEPSERLAMRRGGADNVRNHSWYGGFTWQEYTDLKMTPPYKPQVKSNSDMGNFGVREEDLPPTRVYKDDGSGWDKTFATSD